MLTRLALESAVELEKHLRRRGVAIRPDEETPLEEMVSASEPIKVTSGDVVEEEPKTDEEIIQALEEASVVPLDITPNGHDVVIAQNAEQLAGLINRRVSLAREVINPLINEYVDVVTESLGDKVPQDPEVVPIELGDFYRNPLTAEIFKGYHHDGVGPLDTFTGFSRPENGYAQFTTTGSQFIDDKFSEISEKYGDNIVEDVYTRYFVEGKPLELPQVGLNEDYIRNVDEALVTHFIARRLYDTDDILSNDYKSNDREYRSKLLDILGRTAQIVTGGSVNQSSWETTDVLTGKVASEAIYVFKHNYDIFRKSGGTDYMIKGHRRKGGFRTMKTILSQGSSLESFYQLSIENDVRDFREERVAQIRRTLIETLPVVIDRIPDEVYDSIPEINDPTVIGENRRNYIHERTLGYINNGLTIQPDNLVQTCTDVICQGMIPELNLHTFYAKMESYLNPETGGANMEPAQAAYYVIVEELVDYFLSQTSLSSVTGK